MRESAFAFWGFLLSKEVKEEIKPLNNQRCYKVFTTELTEITEGEFLCELGGFLLFYLRCWYRLFCNAYGS